MLQHLLRLPPPLMSHLGDMVVDMDSIPHLRLGKASRTHTPAATSPASHAECAFDAHALKILLTTASRPVEHPLPGESPDDVGGVVTVTTLLTTLLSLHGGDAVVFCLYVRVLLDTVASDPLSNKAFLTR